MNIFWKINYGSSYFNLKNYLSEYYNIMRSQHFFCKQIIIGINFDYYVIVGKSIRNTPFSDFKVTNPIIDGIMYLTIK